MSIENRIKELKLQLPPAPTPAGVYKPVVYVGDVAYVSGHGPLQLDGSMMTGRIGVDVDQEYGFRAARQTGLAILSSLKAHFRDLGRVKRVIKLLGMVNCTSDFDQHPAVINGCSELFAEVFGDLHGIGARSAVGMGSLPGNITVEVEAIFAID